MLKMRINGVDLQSSNTVRKIMEKKKRSERITDFALFQFFFLGVISKYSFKRIYLSQQVVFN